ncbi:MAG: CARDB domain-containing protein [Thermodesulfobacteriota bacterium]
MKPDLTVKKMKIEPANPTNQDNIRFSASVHNMGMATAGASKAGIKIGGETFPVKFNQGPITMQSSTAVIRLKKLPVGKYSVKFIADIDNQVRESNENNNEASLNFAVGLPMQMTDQIGGISAGLDPGNLQIVFKVIQENMMTYTFPGSNYFAIILRATKNYDAATVNGAVRVNLKYFAGGVLQHQQDLPQANMTTAGNLLTWNSGQTNYASACTSAIDRYCEVNVYVEDTVKSQDGESLDGDNNGQPGGQFHHTFYRGMSPPSP